jgi:hypothetical protein
MEAAAMTKNVVTAILVILQVILMLAMIVLVVKQ